MSMERAAVQSGSHGPLPASVLVGRVLERVVLREELHTAAQGRGRLVLLSGEAGIGKTSLANDLALEARARGVQLLGGSCYDLTNTPPYGPWLDLFASYNPDESSPPPPGPFARGQMERVPDRAALFAAVRQFIGDLAATRPLLITFEDVHWADPASLDLLRDVSHHLANWPVLLLITYRSDELTRRHPFYQQLPALVREANGIRLDLKPLDTSELRSLAATRFALPAADETRLVAYLEQHAEGNPFFTAELLRTLREHRLLQESETGWSLAELDRLVLPPLLRQVIDGRVARFGEEKRQPLAIAAIIGQEFPLDLWADVASLSEDEMMTIVDEAIEANLLDAERDGTRVRFVHALTREALYESVSPPRRRIWHLRVAEALVGQHQPDPDTVAFHFQQARDPRARHWLERAAERAQRTYAWRSAIDRFLAAAALLEGVEGEEWDRAWLLYRAARLQRLSDPVAALAIYDEVERLARHLGDHVLAADACVYRGVTLCYTDRLREGIAAFRAGVAAYEAMPLEESLPPPQIQVWTADSLPASTPIDTSRNAEIAAALHEAGVHYRRGVLPLWLATSGEVREAINIAERFIPLLDGLPRPRGGIHSTVVFSYHGLGLAYAALGRPDDARRSFAQARSIYADLDHHALTAFALLSELRDVAIPYGAANPSERRRVAREAEAALDRAGGALQPEISTRIAWLACLELDGRWDEATAILDALPRVNNTFLRRDAASTRAWLGRHRGNPAEAWSVIDERLPSGPDTAPGNCIYQEGLFLQRLAADLCLDRADLIPARSWLEAHDRWLAWSGSHLGQADGRLCWARYHQVSGIPPAAHDAAWEAVSLASEPDQPLVRLGALRLLGEIETARGEYEAADSCLVRSLDLATVCEAPFERALTLIDLAELRHVTGDRAATIDLLTEAQKIAMPLGAVHALARIETLLQEVQRGEESSAYPANLTPREVEVLRLVAQHLTDKEIAAALFISPRTVHSHVENIRAKLGVANRREAAMAASRLGLLDA